MKALKSRGELPASIEEIIIIIIIALQPFLGP
jgi:hypothetical protein